MRVVIQVVGCVVGETARNCLKSWRKYLTERKVYFSLRQYLVGWFLFASRRGRCYVRFGPNTDAVNVKYITRNRFPQHT